MEKTVRLLVSFSICALLGSCGTARHFNNTSVSQKIEVKESVKIVPYLVKVEIPEIKETIRTRDTASHLENTYAYSDAIVHSDGTLEHSLGTKPQKISHTAEIPVVQKDSIVYVDKVVETTVEKDLNWWQRVRLDGFYILLLVVILTYLKPILKILKI